VDSTNQNITGVGDGLISHSEEGVLGDMWDALREYLSRMEEYLLKAERKFSAWADKELEKLQSDERGNFYEAYAEEFSYHMEFPRILRNSIFMSACSVLEYWMRVICSGLKEKQHMPIRWNDLRGGTIKQFRLYFELAHLDIPVGMNKKWQEIENYYLVRNCIVHEQGLLEKFRNNSRLLRFVEKRGIISEDNGEKEIALTKQFCEETIDIMEDFSHKIYLAYRLQDGKHNSDK